MILDEIANDLDMDALNALEDMLAQYSGVLMVVSHDRDFLDRVVGSLIVMRGNGAIVESIGGWQDYMDTQKKAPDTVGEKSANPSTKSTKNTASIKG